jgi:3-hydroxyacyl-[acyl-carrier-protein] dehydratase
MLMNDFYTVVDKTEENVAIVDKDKPGKKIIFSVKLNPGHPVYKGHFPGNPVVPGVCQVQMIKELSSLVLNKEIILSYSDNIKFLSMIRPSETEILTLSLDIREKENECWSVNAVISRENQVFLKFKGVMIPEQNHV